MAEIESPYGDDAYIVDPEDGKTYKIPKADLLGELRGGAEIASPQEILAFQEADERIRKYGTPGQAVLGGVEKALSTATFGGSTVLERAFGVDPAEIRAREEVNPLASGIGTGVGILGPALVTGGGSAVAQGGLKGAAGAALRATPAGIAISAGERAGAAVARRLPSALAEGVAGPALPLLASTGRRALATATAGAVEGAALQTGALLEEAALGDPRFNGEAVLSDIGLSYLMSAGLGGGLGAAFEGVGGAVVGASRKARNAGEKTFAAALEKYPKLARAMGHDEGLVGAIGRNRARLDEEGGLARIVDDHLAETGAYPRVEAASDFVPTPLPDAPAGATYTPGTFGRRRPEFGESALTAPEPLAAPRLPDEAVYRPGTAPRAPDLEDLPTPKDIAEDARGLGEAVFEQAKATDDAVRLAFDEFRPLERQTLAVAVDDVAAATDTTRVLHELDNVIGAFEARKKLYPAAYREKLKEIKRTVYAGLKDTSVGEPVRLFNALDDLKRELDPLSKFGRDATPDQQAAVKAIRGLRAEVKNSLENPEVWNQLAVRQKALNGTFAELRAAEKDVHRLLFTKKAEAAGGVEWIPAPEKMERFLANLGRPSNVVREEAFARWQTAIRNVHDEIATSAKVLPGKYEREAVEAVLGRTTDRVEGARRTLTEQAEYEAQKAARKAAKNAYAKSVKAFREDEAARREAAKGARLEYAAERDFVKAANRDAENAYAAARKAEKGEQKRSLEEYRREYAAFREDEAAKREAAKGARSAYQGERDAVREANRVGKEAARGERLAFRDATKARGKAVTGAAKRLQGESGFDLRDVAGVGFSMQNPVIALPYAAYKMKQFLASPVKVYRALGAIERMARGAEKAIDLAAGTLVRAGVKGMKVTRAESVAGLAKSFAKTPADALAQFEDRSDKIARLASDPALAMEHFANALGSDIDVAPETSTALQAAAYRTVTYLYEKMPKPPENLRPGVKWTPNRVQLVEWNRLYETLEAPAASILKAASAGTLTKSQVEAVAECYPEVLAAVQAKLVDKLAEHPGETPPQQMRMIRLILDGYVAGDPETTLKNQVAIAGSEPPPSVTLPTKPPSAAKSLDLARRTAPETQRPTGAGE